jgi:phage gp36-like protein
MAYATQANIVTLYGQELLDAVASRDGSGRADPETVTAALDAATAEIDTYLGVRYTVPLDPVPPYIRQVCVDIAVYRMALDIGPRTEEMRVRYADAIAYLKNVAEGKFELPDTGSGGEDPGGGSAGTGARVISAKRG